MLHHLYRLDKLHSIHTLKNSSDQFAFKILYHNCNYSMNADDVDIVQFIFVTRPLG